MSEDLHHRLDAESDHHGGDPDPEIRPRLVVKLILVLAVVTVAFAIVVWPLVRAFANDESEAGDRAGLAVDPARPSGPLLQSDPMAELDELRRHEDEVLESYGWSDEAARQARVPVRRAMEMVLEEGVGALSIGSGDASASSPSTAESAPGGPPAGDDEAASEDGDR